MEQKELQKVPSLPDVEIRKELDALEQKIDKVLDILAEIEKKMLNLAK